MLLQVPEYELIKTEKYHKEDGGLRIRFTAWGDEYVLDLKPNTGLISPHIVSSSFFDSSYFFENTPLENLWQDISLVENCVCRFRLSEMAPKSGSEKAWSWITTAIFK